MQFESIRVLRGLAVCMVVLHHVLLYSITRPNGNVGILFPFGAFGVDLFFVISGFVMTITASSNNSGIVAGYRFCIKRVIRIVPLYWLATLILGGIFYLNPHLFTTLKISSGDLVKSLIFFPVYNSVGELRPIVSQGWTLYYEMYFYILFTIAIILTIKIKLRIALVGFLLLAGNLSSYATGTREIETVSQSFIVFEFFLGCILGCFESYISRINIAIFIFLICLGVLILCFFNTPSGVGINRFLIWGLPAFILVGSAIKIEGFIKRNPIRYFQELGDASYSIYLFHGFTFSIFWKLIVILHIDLPQIRYCLLFFGAIVTGCIIFKLIETPLLFSIRTLLNSKIK